MCHTDTYVMGRTVNRVQEGGIAVSYTHLTLPTKLEV